MIYYFSATGNSRYVAMRIAQSTGERMVKITPEMQPEGVAGDVVGLVCPTYFYGLPTLVADFVRRLRLDEGTYCYLVLTCGGSTAGAAAMCQRLLGRELDARFTVKMPDTWTPMFDISDTEKNTAILDAAEGVIDHVIAAVKERERGYFGPRQFLPRTATALLYPWYGWQRVSKFKVAESCTGCGVCEGECPMHAITLVDGRPQWDGEACMCCLGCLHRCPQFAISYGKNTIKHGQYYNPRVALLENKGL